MKKLTLLFLGLLFWGAGQPVRADIPTPEQFRLRAQYEQAVCPDGTAAIECRYVTSGSLDAECEPYNDNADYFMLAESPGASNRSRKYCRGVRPDIDETSSQIWLGVALGAVAVAIIGGWWWFGKQPQKAITKKSKVSK